MNAHLITLLKPGDCSGGQLKQFHELVLSGKQVQEEGLADRISAVALLAFAYVDGQLAGVASTGVRKMEIFHKYCVGCHAVTRSIRAMAYSPCITGNA